MYITWKLILFSRWIRNNEAKIKAKSRKQYKDNATESSGNDEVVTRWMHINADVSKNHYTVIQNWQWSKSTKPRDFHQNRTFSFLGLYRKYCEADIFEVMRLKKLVREQMAIKKIEEQVLFCDFFSNSSISVFYKDVAVLSYIVQWV